jgi:hypothetical protein
MFAESEMMAAMKGRPSVVFPSVCSWMRGLDFESAVKYANTCDHTGSLRSVPGVKPITEAGVGICDCGFAGVCAPSSEGAPSARASAMRRSVQLRVDLAELVRGLEHVADLAGECARFDGCAVDVADGRLHTG